MRSIELSIGGMTCAAACAGRMERKLNRLDGVRASPNYATEKASVEAPAGAAGPSWCGWSSRRRTARPASSGWRIDCAGCSRRGGDQRAGPRGAGWLGGRECHGVRWRASGPISTVSAPNYARSSNKSSTTIGYRTYEQPDQRWGWGRCRAVRTPRSPGRNTCRKGSGRGEEDASDKSTTEPLALPPSPRGRGYRPCYRCGTRTKREEHRRRGSPVRRAEGSSVQLTSCR